MELALGFALKLLAPAIGAGLAYLGNKLRKYINSKIKHEKTVELLWKLSDYAENAVNSVAQEFVDGLTRDDNGKLDGEDAARAKDLALKRLKNHLGTEGLATAKEVLGLGADALEDLLASKVEGAVADLKRRKARSAGITADMLARHRAL